MRITTKRVTQGFTVTLWTSNYLRTLWVVLPHFTKLSRHGSKAHRRFQEKAAKEFAEWWEQQRIKPKPPPGPYRPNPVIPERRPK